MFNLAYETKLGEAFAGDSMEWLPSLADESVALAITSPPFALLRQKAYGNKTEGAYVDWLLGFANALRPKLAEDGSFVIDLGGAYQRGAPTRTLVQWRFLLRVVDELGFYLAQECYWCNPSKLPSPIEWVNKRKLRLKDPVNTVWWLSKTPWPKADTTQLLQPYSERMKKLLENPETYFAPKLRPSQHFVANTFRDNGGSLPSHLLTIPNSESGGGYLSACKAAGVSPHPARFPAGLPEFFIKLLTNPNDLVIDIFAGSNTTGMVAEKLGRRWATCDRDRNYVAASALRFLGPGDDPASIYRAVCNGEVLDLSAERHAPPISLAAGASSANPSSLQGHSRPAGTQLSPAEAHEREVAVAQGLPISVRANELDITSPHGSRRD